MEKDLDKKLYNDYLNGEKQAFEYLYNKYNRKIEYFIFNIIKDFEKAEDLTQETFMYVMQNKFKDEYSFKYYVYLVARSKAFNFINVEKRRFEINEQYLIQENEKVDKDILEIITKEESKKELFEAIDELDDKYKNAIYLTKIEGLSYEESAKLLGQTLQNTKNLVHRGKKQLRNILLKKGFDNMNKISKVMVVLIATTVILGGMVYAATLIYKKNSTNHNITMNPTYQSTLDEKTINNLWVGTLDLAWKDLEEKIGKNKIEIENENLQIVDNLNNSTFSKEMLNAKDYEINVKRTQTGGYKIDAKLNKELNFLEKFDNFSNTYTQWTFGDSEEYIKYFGINNASSEEMNKNIEILFFNNEKDRLTSNDFAIKLKTKEGDEIILYRTNDNKSFDEYYKDIEEKSKKYTGRTQFKEDDELRIPYVRLNGMISYNELFRKEIKDTNGLYFTDVIQDVNFSLNEKGCNLSSKATVVTEYKSEGYETKLCYFDDKFVIFMKEDNSENPYFALKVDNTDVLEKIEDTDEPILYDPTMTSQKDRYKFEIGEYKLYEDDNYEYYYPVHKTKVVTVFFKDGNKMTVEEALKQGKITMDLLDKYDIDYIKRNK